MKPFLLMSLLLAGSAIAAPIVELSKISGRAVKEVEKLLGPPTETAKTEKGPKRIYKEGSIEVVYINEKADWITVTPTKKIPFTKDALKELGLEVTHPTFSNEHVMRWESLKDYQFISIFPGPNGIDYIYVMTKTK
jgi:hypothetical protein